VPTYTEQIVPGISMYALDAHELAGEPARSCPAINSELRARRILDVRDQLRDTRGRYGQQWYGGLKSLDEAARLIEKGWPEGAERVSRLAASISDLLPKAKSVRRKLRWSDSGDEVDRDRVMAGDLDHSWRSSRREALDAPRTITVETNWGGNCRLTADELFWQGAMAAAVTDRLEDAGYRVEVFANNYTSHRGGYSLTRVRIKEAESPMRPDALAAVLCHAGIFRTFGIFAIEQTPYKVNYVHGAVKELTAKREGLVAAGVMDRDSILFPMANSEAQAVAAIKRAIQSIN
jgi:G3E family GTPase